MPGYPRVDKGNDTLLGRYDGSVIDAFPWHQLPHAHQHAGSLSWRRLLEVCLPLRRHTAAHVQRADVWWAQLRHPLAMGQYINHPPGGTAPNLLVASTDVQLPPGEHTPPQCCRPSPSVLHPTAAPCAAGEEPHLRAYLPNVAFQPPQLADTQPMPAVAAGSPAARVGPDVPVTTGDLVPGIALVATRRLCNEELFLNYRCRRCRSPVGRLHWGSG